MTLLIDIEYYPNEKEANLGIILHDDLHGEGPAITYEGSFEILGRDIMIHGFHDSFIELPEMNDEFFAEPVNSELVRAYAI